MIKSFYDVTEYNVIPDGITDNTKAFKELTEICNYCKVVFMYHPL